MFFRGKKKLEVDLGELEDVRDLLSSFLRSNLKCNVTSSGNKVWVYSEISIDELKRLVNKFVYRRNLNNKYWVALESGSVKIKKFEGGKKHQKREKEATRPSTIKHGW